MLSDNQISRSIDAALEAQYALRHRHPERDEIYRGHLQRSEAVRQGGDCLLDVRYGEGLRCLLDVFPASDRAPVLFFIHGGYWRALDKSYVSFIAEPFRAAGMTVVMPSYDLAPDVRVSDIIDEIRAAFAWVVEHLGPERVVVAGHSAGGQLAAMLALDQARQGGGPIAGLVGVSGVFDLLPLLHTSINHDLLMSKAEAAQSSPLVQIATLPAQAKLPPMLGIVGGDETDGFKQWSADLVTSWRSHGGQALYREIADRNHFTILDRVAEPDCGILRAITEFIN